MSNKPPEVNYEHLKKLVEETLLEFDGGIMDPNMAPFVPHRQSAADAPREEGNAEANHFYDLAYAAREATEVLVEALDDPIYDPAYEEAFKATTRLRNVLNMLLDLGAKPSPDKYVVAPPRGKQKYFGSKGFLPAADSGGDVE